MSRTQDDILAVLWQRRRTVALVFLATLAAAAAATFALPKAYTTRAFVVVNLSRQASSDFEAAQVTQTATRTFAELSQSRNVAASAARRLPFQMSAGEVQGSVAVTVVPDTQLLSVEATAASPERAKAVADVYARVLARRAQQLSEFNDVSATATVADTAPLETSPSRPQPLLYLTVGAVLAAFVALGAGLARHRLDRRVGALGSDLSLLDLPVIGRVPRVGAAVVREVRRGETTSREAHVVAEAGRTLLSSLAFASPAGQRPASVAIVSASMQEGKTTLALDLAWSAAELGLRTVVVDADLRRPGVASSVADQLPPLAVDQGLSTFLSDDATPLPGVSHTVAGERGVLTVVPAGALPDDATSLLARRIADFDERARASFDFVIYDTPPVGVGADAWIVAAQAEAAVLVVDQGTTRRAPAVEAVEQLRRARAQLLGVVLNRVDSADMVRLYGYGGSGRGKAARRARRTRPSVREAPAADDRPVEAERSPSA